MLLRDVAHARTGDKGSIVQIAVFAYDPGDFAWLRDLLTVARVADYLGFAREGAERHEVPGLDALNFVLRRAEADDVTRSLRLDAHGKCQGSLLLGLPVARPEDGTIAPPPGRSCGSVR
jgi:hypothetical protein